MTVDRVRGFAERLRANAERAAAEAARVEAVVEAAQARGIDTSKPYGASAQCSDATLAKARARAATAERDLAAYLDRFPGALTSPT